MILPNLFFKNLNFLTYICIIAFLMSEKIPLEITHTSNTFGVVKAILAFKVSIKGVNMVRYSSFRNEYLKVSKSFIYRIDEKELDVYFYIPEQSFIGVKGALQAAKLKKIFNEYVIK